MVAGGVLQSRDEGRLIRHCVKADGPNRVGPEPCGTQQRGEERVRVRGGDPGGEGKKY